MNVSTDVNPENGWVSGYEGQIAYAFIPRKKIVRSLNWKVKQNGNEYNFQFFSYLTADSYYGFRYWRWESEEKSSDLFKVNTTVYSDATYIYSNFSIIKKTAANSTFDLEFSIDNFVTTQKCSINNITFLGTLILKIIVFL